MQHSTGLASEATSWETWSTNTSTLISNSRHGDSHIRDKTLVLPCLFSPGEARLVHHPSEQVVDLKLAGESGPLAGTVQVVQ